MDFQVTHVRVLEQARLLVVTSVAGDAVEAADPGDCLAPEAWVLALGEGAPPGARLPLVRRVEAAQPGTPTLFALALDAPLAPGLPYALSLMGGARAAYGEPTNSSPVTFRGPATAGIAGQRPGELGGDIALPVRADASGDLALVDRMTALRERMLRMASVRKGAFAHAPSWGRGVEPKRNYSLARLGQEAAALRADLERDPDVRAAEVSAAQGGHAPRFDMVVWPRFSPEPLRLSTTLEAGGSST